MSQLDSKDPITNTIPLATLTDEDAEEALREAEFAALWGENGTARAAVVSNNNNNVTNSANLVSTPTGSTIGSGITASTNGVGIGVGNATHTGSKPSSRPSKSSAGGTMGAMEGAVIGGERSRSGNAKSRKFFSGNGGNGSNGGSESNSAMDVFDRLDGSETVPTSSANQSTSRLLGGLAGLGGGVSSRPATTGTKLAAEDTESMVYVEEPGKYLEENVFPVLLPGIEKLLRTVKRKDGGQVEEIGDPIQWLAQVSGALIAEITDLRVLLLSGSSSLFHI
jgi:hypothetical protein